MKSAVELTGVRKKLGQTQAVDGIDLTIRAGELFGVVGPDGAGKTTTIRMVAGLLDVDEGNIIVLGEPQSVGAKGQRDFIGYMPQQYSLYGDLSVWENMTFFGKLFGLGNDLRVKRTHELLEMVGLERFHKRRADALSGGMYKKLALACALLHQPQLLVLDEPTNGVDPVSRRELWALLYSLVKDGMTVVVSTPDMDEASRCHRLALIEAGRILALGAPNDMVAKLRHTVLVVQSSDRRATEKALLARDDVFDCSPESVGLRVLAQGDAAEVKAWLDRRSEVVQVDITAPHFEDVFLSLIRDDHALGQAA